MKAIQIMNYGPASDLELVEIDKPSINSDQILVKVSTAGVNPVDTYIRSGQNNYTAFFPHIPGSDGAGTIEQIGFNVTGFEVGQRVYFNRSVSGSSAEFTICDPENLFPLADALSFAEGACIGIPFTTAYQALLRAEAKAGDKVLIHGATGAVGTAAIQLASILGMEVVASAGTKEGAQMLQKLGFKEVVMHNQPGHLKPFQFANQGFNIIIEMLANYNLSQDLKSLSFRGRIAVVGNHGTVEINPRDLMLRDASIIGIALANTQPEDLKRTAKAMLPLFEKKVLNPVISKRYQFEELAQAHEDILHPGAMGNLILEITNKTL